MVRSKVPIHLDLELAVDVHSGQEAALVAWIALALRHDRLAAQKEAYISGRITGVAILYASDVLGCEPIDCQIGGCALLAAACVVERAFPSALGACTGKYVPTRGNPTNGTADNITLSKSECRQHRGRKELFLRNLCKIWRVNDAYGRKRFQAALRAPGWVADPPASLPREINI